jgi:hypothetical protein
MLLQQRRIIGRAIFYWVHVKLKDSRWLILHRTRYFHFCYLTPGLYSFGITLQKYEINVMVQAKARTIAGWQKVMILFFTGFWTLLMPWHARRDCILPVPLFAMLLGVVASSLMPPLAMQVWGKSHPYCAGWGILLHMHVTSLLFCCHHLVRVHLWNVLLEEHSWTSQHFMEL